MNETTTTPNAPKLWITCWKCKTKIGVSPQLMFKYIARLFRLELDVLDARYKNIEEVLKEVEVSEEEVFKGVQVSKEQ